MPERPTVHLPGELRLATPDERKPANARRVLPPISKATGGLRPGVDLTRFSDIQGMDDLEAMERMKRLE